MIAAAILAAGRSTRAETPKPMLRIGNRTFVEAVAATARASAIGNIIVVIAQGNDKIPVLNGLADVEIVVSTDGSATGQASSAAAAVRSCINRMVEAVMIWPVDCPVVRPETVELLANRFARSRFPIIVPTHGGRRGHPTIFSRSVWPEILALPEGGLRTIVHADPGRVALVEVSDSGILKDVDTPADYENLLQNSPT